MITKKMMSNSTCTAEGHSLVNILNQVESYTTMTPLNSDLPQDFYHSAAVTVETRQYQRLPQLNNCKIKNMKTDQLSNLRNSFEVKQSPFKVSSKIDHIKDIMFEAPLETSGSIKKKILDYKTMKDLMSKKSLKKPGNSPLLQHLLLNSQSRNDPLIASVKNSFRVSSQVFKLDELPSSTICSPYNQDIQQIRRRPIHVPSVLEMLDKKHLTIPVHANMISINFNQNTDSPIHRPQVTIGTNTTTQKTTRNAVNRTEQDQSLSQSQQHNPFKTSRILKHMMNKVDRSTTVTTDDPIEQTLLKAEISLKVQKSQLNSREDTQNQNLNSTHQSFESRRKFISNYKIEPNIGSKKQSQPEHRLINRISPPAASPSKKFLMGERFICALYKTTGSNLSNLGKPQRVTKNKINQDLNQLNDDSITVLGNTRYQWNEQPSQELDSGQKSIDSVRKSQFKNTSRENSLQTQVQQASLLFDQALLKFMKNDSLDKQISPEKSVIDPSLHQMPEKIQKEQQPYSVLQSKSFLNLTIPDFAAAAKQKKKSPFGLYAVEQQDSLKIQIKCDEPNQNASLTISLIFVDGSHSLQEIKQQKVPTYSIQIVKFDQSGFILNNKGGTFFGLQTDCFARQISKQELNQKTFMIEIEVVDNQTLETILLRYLSYKNFSSILYPKFYVAIMQQLIAKQRPTIIAKNPHCQFYTERPDIFDQLFTKFVIRDMAYGRIMKHYPKGIPSLNLHPHVILETSKQQIIVQSINEYVLCDHINTKFSFIGQRYDLKPNSDQNTNSMDPGLPESPFPHIKQLAIKQSLRRIEIEDHLDKRKKTNSPQGFQLNKTISNACLNVNLKNSQSLRDSQMSMISKLSKEQSKRNFNFLVVNSHLVSHKRSIEVECGFATPKMSDDSSIKRNSIKQKNQLKIVTQISQDPHKHNNLNDTQYNLKPFTGLRDSENTEIHTSTPLYSKRSLKSIMSNKVIDGHLRRSLDSQHDIRSLVEQDSQIILDIPECQTLQQPYNITLNTLKQSKKKQVAPPILEFRAPPTLEFNKTTITFPEIYNTNQKSTVPKIVAQTKDKVNRRSNLRYSLKKIKENEILACSRNNAFHHTMKNSLKWNHLNDQDCQTTQYQPVIVEDQNEYLKISQGIVVNVKIDKLTEEEIQESEIRKKSETRKHSLVEPTLFHGGSEILTSEEQSQVGVKKITVVYSKH